MREVEKKPRENWLFTLTGQFFVSEILCWTTSIQIWVAHPDFSSDSCHTRWNWPLCWLISSEWFFLCSCSYQLSTSLIKISSFYQKIETIDLWTFISKFERWHFCSVLFRLNNWFSELWTSYHLIYFNCTFSWFFSAGKWYENLFRK